MNKNARHNCIKFIPTYLKRLFVFSTKAKKLKFKYNV